MKTSQFKNYEKSMSQVHSKVKKFNAGIYVFELCESDTIVDGITLPWSTVCDSTHTSRLQTYFAFVDNHRVIFYSPYEHKKLKKEFDITDERERHFMRGYYHIENNQLHMELERRSSGKKKMKVIKLSFRIDDYDTLTMLAFEEGDEYRSTRSKNNSRVIFPKNAFSIEPCYHYSQDPINLFWTLDNVAYIRDIVTLPDRRVYTTVSKDDGEMSSVEEVFDIYVDSW